jgi:hypothetical protein
MKTSDEISFFLQLCFAEHGHSLRKPRPLDYSLFIFLVISMRGVFQGIGLLHSAKTSARGTLGYLNSNPKKELNPSSCGGDTAGRGIGCHRVFFSRCYVVPSTGLYVKYIDPIFPFMSILLSLTTC